MGEFTVADLRSVLLESISDMDLEGTAETSYADLGCDSLALMDVAARIRQRVGVQVPDDAIAPAATQAATVAAVNRLLCGHTENRVLIEAPMDRVWSVTNDVARWPELFSEYSSVEILETADNYVKFRLTTHPEDGQTWSWISERRADPVNRVVRARRVETGPFEYMDIRWEYRTVGHSVEMTWRQDFALKPTAPLDDAAMTDRINRNTPVQMARIKRLIEDTATTWDG